MMPLSGVPSTGWSAGLLAALGPAVAAAAAAQHVDPVVPVLLALVFIALGASVGGRLMGLARQPAVLGELLIGVLVGNLGYYLGWAEVTVLREGETVRRIADLALATNVNLSEAALRILPAGPEAHRVAAALEGARGLTCLTVFSFVDLLSRIAILVLLFLVGLETSLGEMRKVGRVALLVAVIGVVIPMGLGMGAMKLIRPESELARDLFIGGILTATSVGITARVLRDLKQGQRRETHIILGAAVMDDVLSLLVLAIVSSLALRGTVSVLEIAGLTVKSAAFLAGALVAGVWLTPRIVRRLARAGIENLKLLFGLGFAFVLSWFASAAGMATIIGAFAAGMILNHFFDRELAGHSLRDLLSPVESLIVPVFFVWMGMQVKLEALLDREIVVIGTVLTVAAIVGKVVSGWGAPRDVDRLAVGIGMMPRGEVGLIFAGIGKGLGVVDDALFSAVVLLVMVTTVLTPPLLRWRLADKPA
jgi:Kef-type K+ transport system membrane component KefB